MGQAAGRISRFLTTPDEPARLVVRQMGRDPVAFDVLPVSV